MAGHTPRDVRRWLSELAADSRRYVLATVVCGVLSAIATIAQMALLAWLVHRGVVDQAPATALTTGFFWLILCLGLRAVLQGLQSQFAARASERVRRQVRAQLSRHWQAVGPVTVSSTSAGSLAREWIDHVEALHGYFARFLPQKMLSVIVPLLILAVVFALDWLAGVFLLISAPLIPLFMALVGMGAEKLNREHFETISRLSGQFLDKVRGLTTLQLFQQTEPAAQRLAERSDCYRTVTMKTLKVAFLSSAVLEFFSSVAIAVVAMYIGFGLLGYLDFGPAPALTLFSGLLILLLAPEFFQPLRTLSQHYHDRAAALGAGTELLRRLNEAGARSTPQSVPTRPRTQPNETGIVFNNVGFTHAGSATPLFRALSVTIPKGQTVALTGASGGGKTTVLNLMAGFLVPERGRIQVLGGQPGDVPFGWLGQRGFLLQGSWADNLRLTTPEASDVAIEAAIRAVGLGDLLDSRPDGIHSQISEDGRGLSGGQARRLSLARIFLADYPLILLDEPTAGLDADSEVFVLESLHKLAERGKTLVFSTHHQALLALADRVLIVADGEVRDA